MSKLNHLRTHCFRGHEWDVKNTIWVNDVRSFGGRKRQCRECKNAARRVWNKIKTLERHGEFHGTAGRT